MPRLTVLPHETLCPEGTVIEAKTGVSICDNLLDNGVEIEHACEKSCACTTCHVWIERGGETLSEIEEREDDKLNEAAGLSPSSRLGCQARVGDADVVVRIPGNRIAS